MPGGQGTVAALVARGGEHYMISRYLNQTATWKRNIGNNGYQSVFADPINIRVRWENRRRIVRNKQGEEVISEARVFCVEPIQPGDLLQYDGKEWPVIAVSETPGLDGRVHYREVAV